MGFRHGVIAAIGLVGVSLCSASVRANDLSAGVALPVPRIMPADGASVQRTSIVLEGRKVGIAITTSVAGAAPVMMTLELPRFGWMGEAEPYPDRHFPELVIHVDGAPVKTQDRVQAFVGDADMSADVLAAIDDPFAIAETPPFVDRRPEAAEAWQRLTQRGAVEAFGDRWIARWQARRTVTAMVPPGPERRIAIDYLARPAFRLTSLGQAAFVQRLPSYCLTRTALRSALGTEAAKGSFVALELAIPAGFDHKAPASVGMSGSQAAFWSRPVEWTAFCGPGGSSVLVSAQAFAEQARPTRGVVSVLMIMKPQR